MSRGIPQKPAVYGGSIIDPKALREIERLAAKCIWWKPVSESVKIPERGRCPSHESWGLRRYLQLSKIVGEDFLRHVIKHAEIGMFDARSWHFWHYRLGLAELNKVPPLPTRSIP
jgi:hypothetical protein